MLKGGSSDDMTDNATHLFLLHPSAQYFSGGHFAIVAWDAADIENGTVRECVSFIFTQSLAEALQAKCHWKALKEDCVNSN